MSRRLVEFPSDNLAKPSRPVDMDDRADRLFMRRTVWELLAAMHTSKLWSLHASQIGRCISTFIVWVPSETKNPLVFVNARVLHARGQPVYARELCGSFPTCSLRVLRSPHVTVMRLTLDGAKDRSEWSGWTGRLIQHEIDHTQGKTGYDRLNEAQREVVRQAMKRHRQRADKRKETA
jgi:peptide deformylase